MTPLLDLHRRNTWPLPLRACAHGLRLVAYGAVGVALASIELSSRESGTLLMGAVVIGAALCLLVEVARARPFPISKWVLAASLVPGVVALGAPTWPAWSPVAALAGADLLVTLAHSAMGLQGLHAARTSSGDAIVDWKVIGTQPGGDLKFELRCSLCPFVEQDRPEGVEAMCARMESHLASAHGRADVDLSPSASRVPVSPLPRRDTGHSDGMGVGER